MPSFTDQTGRTISISQTPRRIISIVPSQTELLSDLGLDDSVIGITKFCIHPQKWFNEKKRIGGTKNLHLDTIKALNPNLIIANKEENTRDQVEYLATLCPVWISDISNLGDACEMISQVSLLTGTHEEGKIIVDDINKRFMALRKPSKKLSVCYLIWREPYMTVGRDTFIHDMLIRCGFENVFADRERYPVVPLDEIDSKQCDYIFLSSEPYPFKEKHALELTSFLDRNAGAKLPARNSGTRVLLTDGEFFSWYGSRLLSSPAYFQTLIDKLQDAAAAD